MSTLRNFTNASLMSLLVLAHSANVLNYSGGFRFIKPKNIKKAYVVRRLSRGEIGHRRAWLLAKREDKPIERITHGPIARMAALRS